MRTRPRANPVSDEAVVLTKAVLRAADRLAIKNAALAKILGLSGPTISRMRGGKYRLERGQKPFELAVLLIRLYRRWTASSVATTKWRPIGLRTRTPRSTAFRLI
jgi:hypothetical protein